MRGGGRKRKRRGEEETNFLDPLPGSPAPRPPPSPVFFHVRFLVAFCVSTRPTGHGAVAIPATRNAGTSGFPRKEGERRVGRRRGGAVRSSSSFSGRIFAQLSSNLPGEETGQAKRERERASVSDMWKSSGGGGSHGKTKPKHTKKKTFFSSSSVISSLALCLSSLPLFPPFTAPPRPQRPQQQSEQQRQRRQRTRCSLRPP